MTRLFTGTLAEGVCDHAQVLGQLEACREHWTHSHWISGRWENTYVSLAQVPALRALLDGLIRELEAVWGQSLRYLNDPSSPEQSSFWFNLAPPGARTGMHRHSERAVVSAVYYLQAEAGAGELYFEEETTEVTPEVGKWASFPPSLSHAVRENRSACERISLALNAYAV